MGNKFSIEQTEELFELPFTTPLQEEAQNIVKELWEESNYSKLWINQKVTKFGIKKYPTVMLYITKKKEVNSDAIIYDCDDQIYIDQGFYLECIGFEHYKPYENKTINIVGTDNEDLKGIALVTIMDMMYHDYLYFLMSHKRVIKIYKSDLDIDTKKYCISSILKDIDEFIDRESVKFNFRYQVEVIRDLNDLHLYYDWIDEGDSFIIQLALEAYQEITYYNEWIIKHNIEEKRFKEKISMIKKQQIEIKNFLSTRPPYYEKIPRHPQDILYELTLHYSDYYGREKLMNDNGVQAIIKIISSYERMPKKSKKQKENEETFKLIGLKMAKLKEKGYTKEELWQEHIFELLGKKPKIPK